MERNPHCQRTEADLGADQVPEQRRRRVFVRRDRDDGGNRLEPAAKVERLEDLGGHVQAEVQVRELVRRPGRELAHDEETDDLGRYFGTGPDAVEQQRLRQYSHDRQPEPAEIRQNSSSSDVGAEARTNSGIVSSGTGRRTTRPP